ncbi:MAG: hypothetical protein ABIN91_22625 [Mucilaginibacter sp.]|uniref:hypothetical protein n=1 Tax=Mucilaginibacter sp. TaxID=1882438 RepID=UPI003267CB76
MDTALWDKVVNFNIDGVVSEYCFTTRLENENYWTANFAAAAILEYKKFMYLAAVSDGMVSPSEIVDIVWHQHLVFTKSYDEFGELLGKKIQHIPSTHHKSEFSKFKLAGDRTKKLYKETFGTQPAEIWEHDTLYYPLNMEKAKFNTVKLISIGIVLFIPLFFAAYFCLYPIYITIHNPDFMLGYTSIAVAAFVSLLLYNHTKLNAMIMQWSKYAFAFTLTPLELVYLQNNEIEPVIHGVVNQLILDNRLSVEPDNNLAVINDSGISDPVLFCVLQTVSANPQMAYYKLVNILKQKPAFNKTARAMDAFQKYVSRSKQFIRLFSLNFIISGMVLTLGAIRLATGVVRDKPVTYITIAVAVCWL